MPVGRSRLVLLALAAMVAGWAFSDTYLVMATKWYEDSAYIHGFIVVPVIAWLVWNKRTELAGVAVQLALFGMLERRRIDGAVGLAVGDVAHALEAEREPSEGLGRARRVQRAGPRDQLGRCV